MMLSFSFAQTANSVLYCLVAFAIFCFHLLLFLQYYRTYRHDRRTLKSSTHLSPFEKELTRKFNATKRFMYVFLFLLVGFLYLAYCTLFVY